MKNILLIEDEENLNRGISLKLKKEGYAVFSAACVSEGLKLFQDNYQNMNLFLHYTFDKKMVLYQHNYYVQKYDLTKSYLLIHMNVQK